MQEWLRDGAGRIVTDWDQDNKSTTIWATETGADGQDRLTFTTIVGEDKSRVETFYNSNGWGDWITHQAHVNAAGQTTATYRILTGDRQENTAYHLGAAGDLTHTRYNLYQGVVQQTVEYRTSLNPSSDWVRSETTLAGTGSIDYGTTYYRDDSRIDRDVALSSSEGFAERYTRWDQNNQLDWVSTRFSWTDQRSEFIDYNAQRGEQNFRFVVDGYDAAGRHDYAFFRYNDGRQSNVNYGQAPGDNFYEAIEIFSSTLQLERRIIDFSATDGRMDITKFDHPNIYQVTDRYDANGTYVSMEWDVSPLNEERWFFERPGQTTQDTKHWDEAGRYAHRIARDPLGETRWDYDSSNTQPWDLREERFLGTEGNYRLDYQYTTTGTRQLRIDYDQDGQRSDKEINEQYDNGRLESRTTHFDQGPEANTTRIEVFFSDRTETSRVVRNETQIRDTTYHSDGRHETIEYDLENRDWNSIFSVVTASGKLDYRRTVYDDGRVRNRDVDVNNDHPWNIIEELYVPNPTGAAGTVRSVRLEYSPTYTAITDYDVYNNFVWNEQTVTYNLAGFVDSIRTRTGGNTAVSLWNGQFNPAFNGLNNWTTGNNTIYSFVDLAWQASTVSSAMTGISYSFFVADAFNW